MTDPKVQALIFYMGILALALVVAWWLERKR